MQSTTPPHFTDRRLSLEEVRDLADFLAEAGRASWTPDPNGALLVLGQPALDQLAAFGLGKLAGLTVAQAATFTTE